MWNRWYLEEDKTYSDKGNMKSPGWVKVINWISKIWYDYDYDQIRKSFPKCGLVDNRLELHSVLKEIIGKNISVLVVYTCLSDCS